MSLLDKMKTWFIKKPEAIMIAPVKEEAPKQVLITIHGFGRRRSKEMAYIKAWGELAHKTIVTFDMFEYETDTKPEFETWVTCAKEKVEEYLNQGYIVDLLGFSMGGVIASYIASQLSVHRLVLIAPAFEYLTFDAATKLVALSATSILKDSNMKFINDMKARILPAEYFPQFMDLVKKYKSYIADVTCPVLLMHGSEDEVVPIRSSRYAYKAIKHSYKKLFIIEEGQHQMMLQEKLNWEVFRIIVLFLDEEIVKTEKIDYNMQEQIVDET